MDLARQPLSGKVQVHIGNSRQINTLVERSYDCVITSPPYPNRISYIREVRPYMYWLGYLNQPREAGDLDWKAIGGTWGIATSRLSRWEPDGNLIPYSGFDKILKDIAMRSPLLANYVHKYFSDIAIHLSNLRQVLVPGAKIFYIIGNSKFYDSVVPVEDIYISLMRQLEFKNIKLEVLRKRNSKKELYEFIVSAERS